MTEEPVIKWFIHWGNKADQWKKEYLPPKYTMVHLTPSDTMVKTHQAFPLAGVFGYCQQDNYDIIMVKKAALQWASNTGERVVIFLVHPQTRGIQVLEGAEVIERVPAKSWQEKDTKVLTIKIDGVKCGALGAFFQAINSWRGDWVKRRETPIHLWNVYEKKKG